jgi:rsbT co-antagonist protein RsbR
VNRVDVNEMQSKIAALEARLAEAERALAEETKIRRSLEDELGLLRAALDTMPVGVVVMDTSGRTRISNAAMRLLAGGLSEELPGALLPPHETLMPDGVTPSPPERDPLRRALAGHDVDDLECLLVPEGAPERARWISSSARPICGPSEASSGAVSVTRDITEHKEILRELDDAVAASEAEKRALIGKLEAGIEALSTPIIEVWDDVLALPIIGAVDERRGAEITSRLLDEVVRRGSRFVIVDWTGVDTMDTASAQHLLDLVRAVELVGAGCVLTGIRPAVAVSLLHLDVRFEHLRLLGNVKYGLRHCLAELGRRAGRRGGLAATNAHRR